MLKIIQSSLTILDKTETSKLKDWRPNHVPTRCIICLLNNQVLMALKQTNLTSIVVYSWKSPLLHRLIMYHSQWQYMNEGSPADLNDWVGRSIQGEMFPQGPKLFRKSHYQHLESCYQHPELTLEVQSPLSPILSPACCGGGFYFSPGNGKKRNCGKGAQAWQSYTLFHFGETLKR